MRNREFRSCQSSQSFRNPSEIHAKLLGPQGLKIYLLVSYIEITLKIQPISMGLYKGIRDDSNPRFALREIHATDGALQGI